MQTKELSTDKNERRRGRPAGKNRTPLSLAERRARNAQYERERRNEAAEAMAQLAEAAGCNTEITNPELLATVINRLQNAASNRSQSIDDLKLINDKLESQIAALQSRLENDCDFLIGDLNDDSDDSIDSHSDSVSDYKTSSKKRPSKYLKTTIQNTVHDEASTQSSRELEYASDSQDSVWSQHQFENFETITPKKIQISNQNEKLECKSRLKFQKPSPIKCDQASLEDEFYSENSNQSEAYCAQTNQEVNVEFQLVPKRDDIKTEPIETPSDSDCMDPFTDREKLILESLGFTDFINFDDHETVQTRLTLPLDFDSVSGY